MEAKQILAAKTQSRGYGFEGTYVDQGHFIQWQVKVRNLLSLACGVDSVHLRAFEKQEKSFVGDTNYGIMQRQEAVLLAARDDYEGGYLSKIRNLVQAEVFDNELEQAEELLAAGYATAAAVIAGTVLETSLRQICADRGLGVGKLDKMNADLAKAGAYNSILQKRITAIAGIRNAAAHGDANAFRKDDVEGMIQDIRRFLAMSIT